MTLTLDRTDPKSASRVTPNIDVPGSSPSPIRLRLQSADGVKRRRWTPDTGHQSSFVDTISASAPEDDIGAPAEGHLRTSLTVPPPDNPQHEKWYVSGAQAGHVERNDSTCTLDPSPPDSASSLPGSNPSSSGPSEVMIPEEVSAGEKHGAWNDGLSMGAQLPEPDEKIVRSRTAPPYLTGGRGPCLEVRETSRALGRGMSDVPSSCP